MLLFILILVVIGVVIFLDWRTKQIIQQCNNYINQICDNGDDIKYPEQLPDFLAFLKKHAVKANKLLRTNNEFNELIKNFDIKLGSFTREIIHEKELSLYKKQLSNVLTHTIKDKELKKQIVAEIQNSEYIPKIENNEEDNFKYNLLNHFVHKNDSGWEYIEVKYPEIFKQINTLCLQYLKDNSYYMNALISNLQKIGQKFTQPITDGDNAYKTYQKTGQVSALKTVSFADSYNSSIIKTLGEYLYPKTNKEILEYLVEKKLIDITTAKKYKSILDRTYDKKKAEKEIEVFKEIYGKDYSIEINTEQNVRYLYVRYIIEHGDINDYLWLSDKLGRILFRVDSPYRWYPLERSNDDWLKAHKKILNARTYGINPLLLFGPDDFKKENSYDGDNITIFGSVRTESVIRLKQDIDNALSNYYPVPNFLNHAKEILDAYITGNTFNAKMHSIHKQTAAWHDNYDRKLREIQLSTLSPYESFGFSVGYLRCSLNLEKRIPVKDFLAGELQDSAFVAYLQSMDKEIFDDKYKYCWETIETIGQNNLVNSIFNKGE